MNEVLYKVTADNGSAYHGGSGRWPLPNGAPGAWLDVDGDLSPCSNGLHLCRADHLLAWLGPAIWEAEYEGEAFSPEPGDKIVVRKARILRRCEGWTEQTSRLFAADCAERVLSLSKDDRCEAAVKAARMFAFGLIDAATWDAARAAAWDAAWDATKYAAKDAASAAAIAAAWTASRAAARAAAWDAAWDAASAAAWEADWAAMDSAWDAASATRAAAWTAERRCQSRRLMEYIQGNVDLDAIRKGVQLP